MRRWFLGFIITMELFYGVNARADTVQDVSGSISISPRTPGFNPIGGYFLLKGTIKMNAADGTLSFQYAKRSCTGSFKIISGNMVFIPLTCSDGTKGVARQVADTCSRTTPFDLAYIELFNVGLGILNFGSGDECPILVN